MVWKMLPLEINTKKRLVKSPKVFVRDSGLLHRLLEIDHFNSLLGHPVFGPSWEGMVIENICSSIPDCRFSFYRSASGDELDLIIQKRNTTIAIECKASTSPKLNRNTRNAINMVKPDKTFIVAPIREQYPLEENVMVCNLSEIIDFLQNS